MAKEDLFKLRDDNPSDSSLNNPSNDSSNNPSNDCPTDTFAKKKK